MELRRQRSPAPQAGLQIAGGAAAARAPARTSCEVDLHHEGGLRLYGSAEDDMPLPVGVYRAGGEGVGLGPA
jgi:hypothetical protein